MTAPTKARLRLRGIREDVLDVPVSRHAQPHPAPRWLVFLELNMCQGAPPKKKGKPPRNRKAQIPTTRIAHAKRPEGIGEVAALVHVGFADPHQLLGSISGRIWPLNPRTFAAATSHQATPSNLRRTMATPRLKGPTNPSNPGPSPLRPTQPPTPATHHRRAISRSSPSSRSALLSASAAISAVPQPVYMENSRTRPQSHLHTPTHMA